MKNLMVISGELEYSRQEIVETNFLLVFVYLFIYSLFHSTQKIRRRYGQGIAEVRFWYIRDLRNEKWIAT